MSLSEVRNLKLVQTLFQKLKKAVGPPIHLLDFQTEKKESAYYLL